MLIYYFNIEVKLQPSVPAAVCHSGWNFLTLIKWEKTASLKVLFSLYPITALDSSHPSDYHTVSVAIEL